MKFFNSHDELMNFLKFLKSKIVPEDSETQSYDSASAEGQYEREDSSSTPDVNSDFQPSPHSSRDQEK